MRALAVALVLAGAVAAGCVVTTRTVPGAIVYESPPPPRARGVLSAPYPGAIWVNGYWGWSESGWVWIEGHWESPRAGYVWVQPRWEPRGRGWILVEGRWRPHGRVHVGPEPRRRPVVVQPRRRPVEVRPAPRHRGRVEVRPR